MKTSDIVIIGAPRSGTNMLRDLLASFDSLSTWPCDEINYIWRYGNTRFPSDQIPKGRASPSIKKYIRKKFNDIRREQGVKTIIEKTCANSLRVPFVNEVLPTAKYVYIVRDGIDVVGSAKLRWKAKLELDYIWKKAKYVPLIDIPYYSLKYLWSRLYMLISHENHLAFWGPKLNNLDKLLKEYSLNEVCALQWEQCVELSDSAFQNIPSTRFIKVKYEELVSEPLQEMQRILSFLDVEYKPEKLVQVVQSVSPSSIGKGRAQLGSSEVFKLEELVKGTLSRHGYK